MKRGVLSDLAAYVATLDAHMLPAAVVEKAKACLLYGAAVAIAGMRISQPAQAVIAVAGDAGGGATRFWDGGCSTPGSAAFANGTLFHARVQDDAHPAGHVGVVVLPASLAVAEALQADGPSTISALVAGYETALRIGRDHAADLSRRGFRTTPAYGVFGAAAASSRLMRLDAGRTAHAMALAANMAGGLREFSEVGSEDFAFQAGTAASNGILAAKLAAAGATGAMTALEGQAGFFRAYGNDGRSYAGRVTERLGESFELMGVTYKPYPICQFHRGVVRGCCAVSARARAPLAALNVRMHPFEADFFGVRFAGPFATFPQTFMSVPFCAALAWARGEVTYAGLTDFAAADVLDLVPKVTVTADSGRARYAPRLQAELADGSMLDWEEHERAGTYALTWRAACDMSATLCNEVGVARHADELIAAVSALEAAPGVQSLVTVLRNACAAARLGAREESTEIRERQEI